MSDRDRARELSERLDQVLELDTTARAAWLADFERTEPAVAAELRELLAVRERMNAQGFLEGAAMPADAMPAPASLVGAHLGPWVIEAEVGRGGMGSVWRARRDDGRIDAFAAIKFVNLALLGRDGEQRFRREGLLLGRLNHPNIARLLDAGVYGEPHQPYLVLEYVDGLPIDAWCESRALDARHRIELFLRVIQAVAHAHSHLIIHRDLKPSNILVTAQGDVKLLDFGIARLASSEDGVAHTRSSAAAMTPQYAAPEQLQGGLITTRTDVYSLGLVLYRLLTGRHAVEFDANASAEMFRSILERDPPPPSGATRARGVTSDELRGDLDNIVAKVLRKSPGERYASAGDLAQDLERFLCDEPVTARADTVTYRVGKFVRRHRGGVAAAMLTALALIAATVITTQQAIEARRQRNDAQFQAQRAEAAADFLATTLSAVGLDGQPLSPRQLIDRGVTMLEAQYESDPRFLASMLLIYAGRYGAQSATDESLRLFERAEALASSIGDLPLSTEALCQLAFQELMANRTDHARARIERARRQLRQISTVSSDLRWACARAEVRVAKVLDARPDEAMAILLRTRADFERQGDRSSSRYTSVLRNIAGEHTDRGEMVQALELLRLSGRIHELNGRGGTVARLQNWQSESVALYRLGEIRESHAQLERYTGQIVRAGPRPELGIGMLMDRAGSLNRLGRSAEALPLATGLGERALRDGHTRSAGLAFFELARTRHLLGMPRSEVEPLLARIREISGEHWQANTGLQVLVESVRVDWDIADGRLEEAAQRIAALLAQESMQSPDHVRPRRLAQMLAARIGLERRDFAAAAGHAREALALAEASARGADTSADVGEALLLQARIQAAQGQMVAARAGFERAERCLRNGYGPQHALTLEAARRLAQLGAQDLMS